ncbi:MAG TPA: hypothetical protein DCR59_00835 [Dehalococcoidia bacterium]|nr:hypothetical protein [Dehalococcoidia bacterium]
MPQMERGGKYVFGWSQVSQGGVVVIPGEAIQEYGLNPGTEVTLISGSNSSGGFVVAIKSLLKQSKMGSILTDLPDLDNEQTEEGRIFVLRDRKYCRSRVGNNNTLELKPQVLEAFNITPGDRLLSVRGSYIGLSMISKGLIVKCAKRHSELECY